MNANLDVLEEQAVHRSSNGDYLNELLNGIEGVIPLRHDPYVTRNAYHIYTFRYQKEAFDGLPREQFAEALAAEGVPASTGYKRDCRDQPLFLQSLKSIFRTRGRARERSTSITGRCAARTRSGCAARRRCGSGSRCC